MGEPIDDYGEIVRISGRDYLVALQRHHPEVVDTSADWMPWNYQETLARLRPALAAPP